jgi:glycosyltransferase involved in cell wall biosynthesis
MIPTFNCAKYLRETLKSVLVQDPGPEFMQIEVVDDCSTKDDPLSVVTEIGGGRISFYRQSRNVGHTANFNTCIQRSRGELVHLLHGDDSVREDFYLNMCRPFDVHRELGAAFCRDIRMDESGRWLSVSSPLQPESGILNNWLETIALGQRLQAPAMVVRRTAYERLNGFDRRLFFYGEDWEMWVRIAAHYPVWYVMEPLAVYRIRDTSLSGQSLRTGQNGYDYRKAIEINQAYFPSIRASEISQKARENFALACLRRAHRLFKAGEQKAAFAQLREAIRSRWSL